MLHHNISLKPYNTFGLDVNAQYVAMIRQEEDLEEVYDTRRFVPLPKVVLGGGSNILLTGNQRRVFMKMEIDGIRVVEEDEDEAIIEAGAGIVWHQLVLWCVERNLGGIENLSLIPGTVGAAPIQNIGAYGVELESVFDSLDAFEGRTGERRQFSREECQFGYRDSVFKGKLKGKYIVTRVRLRLTKKNHQFHTSYGAIGQTLEEMKVASMTLEDISRAVIHIRQSKLPDPAEIGNAGSFFKNPVVEKPLIEALKELYPSLPTYPVDDGYSKIPAAWLIDQCGWKGTRRGDVGVHVNQPLVLVNYGGGTGKELVRLSRDIQQSVSKTFGIDLQREVNVL